MISTYISISIYLYVYIYIYKYIKSIYIPIHLTVTIQRPLLHGLQGVHRDAVGFPLHAQRQPRQASAVQRRRAPLQRRGGGAAERRGGRGAGRGTARRGLGKAMGKAMVHIDLGEFSWDFPGFFMGFAKVCQNDALKLM